MTQHPEYQATLSAERKAQFKQPTPLQVGLGSALTVLVFVYPFVFDWLVETGGVRLGSMGLLAYGILFAVARSQMGIPVALISLPHIAMVTIVAVTFVTEDVRYLLLVPALIYLLICRLFWASLSQEISIIEHVARFIVPFAPDFIRSYCRKSTVAWCVFFVANAMVIAGLALSGQTEAWRAYTGWMMFAIIGVICLIDFLFRKWWFRYYFHQNWFDRVWSRMFPAEDTALGRQSLEYIRQKRDELGLPPP